MKYIKIIMLLALIAVTNACKEDDVDTNNSVFTKTTMQQSEFDKWLEANYAKPYNIEFNYRYVDKLTNNNYNVVPANEKNSRAMSILLKHVWLDAYTELMGKDFLMKNCFRVIQLIGSPEYDGQNKIILGTAEGGIQITLFRINNLDLDNLYVNQDDPLKSHRDLPLDLNYWYFHTMHHEFCHILTQKKEYSTEYRTVSVGKYHTTDWINVSDEQALHEGFISGYASEQYNEDFAEMYSTYVTSTPAAWKKLMNEALIVQKDQDGNILYQKDKNGNDVYKKDANGNLIPLYDKDNNLMPATDAKGNIMWEKDKDGKYIYILDSKGNRIPRYSIHKNVKYQYDEDGSLFAYFVFKGNAYPVTAHGGDPIYQVDEDGNTIFDKDGNPVPEYFKVPVFEYERAPQVDTTGLDAILKKLDILRSYFLNTWGIDIDKLRDIVTRRASEIHQLDLKTLK